jgi:hypothetical protein
VRVLFDQGTPVPLRDALSRHEVSTAYERGWSTLDNGDLLDAAEREGFDVFVTTDQNLKHQQKLSARRIAIVVLTSTSWPRIQRELSAIVRAIDATLPEAMRRSQLSNTASPFFQGTGLPAALR